MLFRSVCNDSNEDIEKKADYIEEHLLDLPRMRELLQKLIDSGAQYGYVQIIDNGTLSTALPTKLIGAYQIFVESIISGGATATFMAAKASQTYGGNLVRTTSSTSLLGEQLNILWTAAQPINLIHSIPRTISTGAFITYKYYISYVI